MSDAAGGEPSTEDDIVAAARALLTDAGIGTMLVTRGAQGMSLVSADSADHFPSRAREVFDVSGDTVIATLAAGIAAGLPPVDAAQLANVAAGIVVGKTGTAVAYAEDIQVELNTLNDATGLSHPLRSMPPSARSLPGEDRGEKSQLHQWLFRSAAPWACLTVVAGAGSLRPVGGWPEFGCLGQTAEG